jgi:hypothetical protein
MKKLLICLPLLVVASQAHGQLQKERAEASNNVLIKAAQLDLLNQLLPLVFTKEQWRKLLPSVEKARELVKTTERQEADELLKLEKRLNDAYTGAIERGELPKPELMNEYHTKIAALNNVRRMMAETNILNVMEVFEKTANAGQRKTAMNSLNPKMFGRVEEMKDEDKVRLFVSEILLHPLAYELMTKLSIGN